MSTKPLAKAKKVIEQQHCSSEYTLNSEQIERQKVHALWTIALALVSIAEDMPLLMQEEQADRILKAEKALKESHRVKGFTT